MVTMEHQSISDLFCLLGLFDGGYHQGDRIALLKDILNNEAIVQVFDSGLKLSSIQLRIPYYAAEAFSGGKSVKINQGSRCFAPQQAKRVPSTALTAKQVTFPVQTEPGHGSS